MNRPMNIAILLFCLFSLLAACKTTHPNQSETKADDPLPAEIIERANKTVIDQSDKLFAQMMVDLVLLQEQDPKYLDLQSRISEFWIKTAFAPLSLTAAGGLSSSGSVITIDELAKYSAKVDTNSQLINAIAGSSAKVGRMSVETYRGLVTYVIKALDRVPGVPQSVRFSINLSSTPAALVNWTLTRMFGRKATAYTPSVTIIGSLATLAASGSGLSSKSLGQAAMKRSEWVRKMSGLKDRTANNTRSYVETIAATLEWHESEKGHFHEALNQAIIDKAIENNFDTKANYAVDTFAIIDQIGLQNARSEAAKKLFSTLESLSQSRTDIPGPASTEETILMTTSVAALLQQALETGNLSIQEKSRINSRLADMKKALSQWEELYNPAAGL